jgi:hypothetical protein
MQTQDDRLAFQEFYNEFSQFCLEGHASEIHHSGQIFADKEKLLIHSANVCPTKI